jgi:hypothetical protein
VRAGELSFAQVAAALKKGGKKLEGGANSIGWASRDDSGHLAPFEFKRRAVGADDIAIQIAFAGICHSDLHQIKNEWGGATFPMVPGCAQMFPSKAHLHACSRRPFWIDWMPLSSLLAPFASLLQVLSQARLHTGCLLSFFLAAAHPYMATSSRWDPHAP